MQNDIEKIASDFAKGKSLEQMRDDFDRRDPARRFAQSEKSEAERAYWQKVWMSKAGQVFLNNRQFTPEQMPFEQAKKSLWKVFLQRADELTLIQGKPFAWQFDEKEAEIINDLMRYFLNDPAGKLPIYKGLFIYGAVGTGKTEIIQIFEKWAKEQGFQKQFTFTSMSQIYTRAKTESDFDPVTPNLSFDRCFDEFGRYTGNVVNFGNPLDINEAIIEQRYARFQRYGQLTHFIANAQPNELEAMFSPMIYDRIRSMCVSVFLPGKSKRK